MRVVKFLGLGLILVLSFWGGMRCERELKGLEEIGKPSFKKEQLYFDKFKTSLFIKSKTWGLTGDHSQTVLSLSEEYEFTPDSLNEFIFNASGLFYRQTSDSLIVYHSYMNSKPQQFETPIKLKFIEVDNSTYISLESKVKSGLRKFE